MNPEVNTKYLFIMANRHLARSIVLQSLYEADFRNASKKDAAAFLKRNSDDIAPGTDGISFMEELLDGVLTKQKDLDNVIAKAAPQWPIEKISVVDRNILRIGLYELLFGDRGEVPPKVAINEAIELAKSFGGDTSSKFVNGVLGAVYKELGEPDKEGKTQKKKKKIEDIPYEDMPVQHLGGGVVYARDGEDIYLALVHDVFGHWTLSKGKLGDAKDLVKATAAKIKDELGVDVDIQDTLGENEYVANDPEIGKLRKQVTYYLAESEFTDLTLGSSGGLDDAQWFKLSDIIELNFYDDILPIITKAINILLGKESEE